MFTKHCHLERPREKRFVTSSSRCCLDVASTTGYQPGTTSLVSVEHVHYWASKPYGFQPITYLPTFFTRHA